MELNGNLNYNKCPENYGLQEVMRMLEENKIFSGDEKNFVTLQFLFALGINSDKNFEDYNYESNESFEIPPGILERNYSSIILMLFAAYDKKFKSYSYADLQDVVSHDLSKYKYLISENLKRGYLEFEVVASKDITNLEKYIELNEILKKGLLIS